MERLPSLVIRAQALARQAGFALTREEAGPGRPSACLPGVASAVRELFAADPRIEVVTGDALRVMPGRGPFDLLFADSGVRDRAGFGALVSSLRVSGRIVMDDVTPERALPPDSPLRAADIKREFFSGEPRLVWTEVVLPDLHNSLLVGTRTN